MKVCSISMANSVPRVRNYGCCPTSKNNYTQQNQLNSNDVSFKGKTIKVLTGILYGTVGAVGGFLIGGPVGAAGGAVALGGMGYALESDDDKPSDGDNDFFDKYN